MQVKFTSAADYQPNAALGLHILGPLAESAVPELTVLLQDDQTRSEAAIALVGIGGHALRPVLDGLSSTNAAVRLAMVDALSLTHPADAAVVVPALLPRLKDGDLKVRIFAHGTLGNTAKEPQVVLPALLESLQDPSVRSQSLWAIGRFGTNATPLIPVLLKLFDSADTNVQRRVVETLREIDPEAVPKYRSK